VRNMKKYILLLMAKKLLMNPRFLLAILVLTLALIGHPVLAKDDPKLPGDPDPSPDPFSQ